MKQRTNNFATVAILLSVLLSFFSTATGLQCYECSSDKSWSDCHSNANKATCAAARQVSILGQDIFLQPQQRQVELACLSVSAQATISGITGTAYVRSCFYNDKSMCSLIESQLPTGFKVTTCDLCTTDLCNDASSVTLAFSSILLMAIAVMLRM